MKPKGDLPHLRYLLAKEDYFKYRRLMKTLESSLSFSHSDVAKFRWHVLSYYYKWGLNPALDAFKVRKSTLYDWKKAYEESHKRLVSLVPRSTKPCRTRRMETDWRLVEFIREMRIEYGNVGANIIKPFLDEYAQKEGLKTVCRSTVEKVIKRRKFTFENRIKLRKQTKYTKLRTRRSPHVKRPGFIQMDSIVVYVNKEKHLFMSVIDIYTKFALVEKVGSLSSLQARRVFTLFQRINPTTVDIVQTDNGSEFLSTLHDYLEEEGIRHQFIYPRLVRVNGVIERFNRTIQEEFIRRSDELYYDLESFERKLVKYLYWYNYKRPHHALKYLSPMQFINSQIPKS